MVPFYGINNNLINNKNDFYKWTHLYIFDISNNYNNEEPSGNYIKISNITQPGNITIDTSYSDISYIDISYLPIVTLNSWKYDNYTAPYTDDTDDKTTEVILIDEASYNNFMYIGFRNIIHDSYNYHVSVRNWFSLQENEFNMIYFYIPSNSINILNSSYSLELWATGRNNNYRNYDKEIHGITLLLESITYSNKKNIYLQYGIAFPTKHTIWNGKDGNSYDGRLDHTTYLRQNAQFRQKIHM